MSRFRVPAPFLATALFLSFAMVLISTTYAQSQAPATPAEVVPRMYDASKETVISGAISEVVARPKAGLPLGLHLMLSTAQGQVDVHLGPYLGRIAAQKGLVPGAALRVTGVISHFRAGDVFLARTVTVGNETIVIRNQNGIPARPSPAGTRPERGSQPSGGQ